LTLSIGAAAVFETAAATPESIKFSANPSFFLSAILSCKNKSRLSQKPNQNRKTVKQQETDGDFENQKRFLMVFLFNLTLFKWHSKSKMEDH